MIPFVSAWDCKWLEIEAVEQWPIFHTIRTDSRYNSGWTFRDEVPDGRRFRTEIMQIARGDDDLFERYMYDLDIVDVYERSALRLAGHEYRPER